jgi:HD-GYP domain-containing protein (c-di-GMP phosphodiesterase class II)
MRLRYSETVGKVFYTLMEIDLLREYAGKLTDMEHGFCVGLVSLDMGLENQVGPCSLYLLGSAGILHDIGKNGVPEEILNKRSELTAKERKAVEMHSRYGFEMLKAAGLTDVGKIVVAVHELQDNPYPRKRIRKRNRLVEIVAAADMYDGLASKRPYKEAFPFSDIEAEMKKNFRGDPKYVTQVLSRTGLE